MSTTTELLPCPFCGSAEVSESVGTIPDGTPFTYIECESCEATATPKNWNRRAHLAGPVPATIEKGPWKSGNEFLPYHPSASHVNPAYRDGWNACWEAAHVAPPAPKDLK